MSNWTEDSLQTLERLSLPYNDPRLLKENLDSRRHETGCFLFLRPTAINSPSDLCRDRPFLDKEEVAEAVSKLSSRQFNETDRLVAGEKRDLRTVWMGEPSC